LGSEAGGRDETGTRRSQESRYQKGCGEDGTKEVQTVHAREAEGGYRKVFMVAVIAARTRIRSKPSRNKANLSRAWTV
jgi:hypothetical protein